MDTIWLNWLVAFGQSPFGRPLVFFCLNYLPVIFVIVVLAYLGRLFLIGQYRQGKQLLLALVIASVLAKFLAYLLKIWLAVKRPSLVFTNLQPLLALPADSSFPSGHTLFFAALAAIIYSANRRLGFTLGLAALLIGFARVAAGIHWPSDIIAGYILGVGLSTLLLIGLRYNNGHV